MIGTSDRWRNIKYSNIAVVGRVFSFTALFTISSSSARAVLKERREGEIENGVRVLKSQMMLRCCAKAALLLSELKSLTNLTLHDNEILRRIIEYLKIQLVRQRLINKRVKLCALSELIVQVVLVKKETGGASFLSLSTRNSLRIT